MIVFNRNELENPMLLNINRLESRATVIPAKCEDVFYRNKENSAMIQSLNGDYRFWYAENDVIEDFFMPKYDDNGWNSIEVPSVWT